MKKLEKADSMAIMMHAQRDSSFKSTSRRITRWVDHAFVNYHKFCPAEAWAPLINIYEDDKLYVVVADLAGVKWDSIEIRVDEKGVMVISGCRNMPETPSPSGRIKLHLMEIDYGAFCRSIDLPEDADIQAIPEALYKAGFLYVSIPKKTQAKNTRTVRKISGNGSGKH